MKDYVSRILTSHCAIKLNVPDSPYVRKARLEAVEVEFLGELYDLLGEDLSKLH
jgi:hypothetical protein